LINALDTLFSKKSAILFPISALPSHLLKRTEIMDYRQDPLYDEESTKMVDAVTRAFLRSKAVQVAVYYCFHQRIESATICGLQVLLGFALVYGIFLL
jgi:fused-like protein